MNKRVARALKKQAVKLTTTTDNKFVELITKKKTKVSHGGKIYDKVIDFVTMRRAEGTTEHIYEALKVEWNATPRRNNRTHL